MKNRTYIIFASTALLFFVTSCKMNSKDASETEEKEAAVEITEEIEEAQDPILLGIQKRASLEVAPYDEWFTTNYKEHTLDTTTIASIKNDLAAADITVFMGTWCEDSQRETPAFYKVIDFAGIDSDNIKLITVSEDKDTPDGLEEGLDITNVPTIIFSKEGKELGRIVEYPIESLEKDMAKILTGKDYKHAYEE